MEWGNEEDLLVSTLWKEGKSDKEIRAELSGAGHVRSDVSVMMRRCILGLHSRKTKREELISEVSDSVNSMLADGKNVAFILKQLADKNLSRLDVYKIQVRNPNKRTPRKHISLEEFKADWLAHMPIVEMAKKYKLRKDSIYHKVYYNDLPPRRQAIPKLSAEQVSGAVAALNARCLASFCRDNNLDYASTWRQAQKVREPVAVPEPDST